MGAFQPARPLEGSGRSCDQLPEVFEEAATPVDSPAPQVDEVFEDVDASAHLPDLPSEVFEDAALQP
eukprot:241747-Alexandrium_andersonii.AAC.1